MPQRPEGVTAQTYFPEVHWAAVETSTVPPAPIPGICYGYANPLVRTTVQNGRETGRHREASLEAANSGSPLKLKKVIPKDLDLFWGLSAL